MRRSHFLFPACLPGLLAAQSLTPAVTASAGGSGGAGGTVLQWTLGETAVSTLDNGAHRLTQGFHQADPLRVHVHIDAVLEGPYNSDTGLMGDGLRTLASFPLTEPYTAAGYAHVGGGGETVSPAVLSITGANAVVDWVVMELRSAVAPSAVLGTCCALLQRDGDVVDTDGTSAVAFALPPANYHLALRHRNHLGVMTLSPIALTSFPVSVNFASAATATYGTDARRSIAGTFPSAALWSGDVTFNGQVKYTGSGNDRDPILVTVGSTTPNNVVGNTYSSRDVNMDGSVKYTGLANDRDPILVNVGSTPNNVRMQQLP